MRTRWVLVGVVAVALAAVIALLSRSSDAPADAPSRSAASASAWWPYAGGSTYRYRFTYEGDERVTPMTPPGANGAQAAAGAAIGGRMALDGELELRAADRSRAELVITKLDRATLDVNGSAVPGLETILVGQPLGLARTERGAFSQYLTPPDADSLAVQTLRGLAMRMQVTGPDDAGGTTWSSTEVLPHGVAMSEHTRAGDELVRERPRYASLDIAEVAGVTPAVELAARATVDLRDDGVIERLRDAETLVARHEDVKLLEGTNQITLELLEVKPLADALAMQGWTARPLAEVPTSGQLAQRQLEQRAEGMTPAEMLALFQRHMNGGRFPDHNRTLWRMAAVLEQHPELARRLLELFRSASANSRARGLILDMLASVGHAEAQAAMREALQSDAGRGDEDYRMLYQRLGMLESPDADTRELVSAELARARQDGDLNQTMLKAYTAGAVAGHAATDTPEARDPIADELSGMLQASTTPVEQKHLVKALGNAKRPADHEVISGYADSEDNGVRQSVARALSEPNTKAGLTTLLAMLSDADPFVQQQVIGALRRYTLEAGHYARIEAVVRAGQLHKRNHRVLLDLVKYDRERLPEATARVLDAMLTLDDLEGAVRGAINSLLAR